jgi:hypothetical protein
MLLFVMPWSRQFLVALIVSPNSLSGSLIPYDIKLPRKITPISTVVSKRNDRISFMTNSPSTVTLLKTLSSLTDLDG